MKRIWITVLIFAASLSGYAQDYRKMFTEAFSSGEADSLSIRTLLEKWENEKPNESALYPAWLNYCYNFGKTSILALGNDSSIPDEDKAFALADSTKNVVGYLYEEQITDNELLRLGFQKIDEGIRKHPDRLDFRFGKAFALLNLKDYKNGVRTLIDVVEHSVVNDNRWLWDNDEPLPRGQIEMLNSLQDYFHKLNQIDTGYAEELTQSILKHYPNEPIIRSNLGVTYFLQQEYKKALEQFLLALKLSPEDPIIIGNVAESYRMLGEHANAIHYYNELQKSKDDYYRQFAEEKLKELTKEEK